MTRRKNARRQRSLRQIFAIPAVLGLLSAIGLLGALVGDDLYDVIGWIGLGIPVAVIGWHIVRPAYHL